MIGWILKVAFCESKIPLLVDKDHFVCDEDYQITHVEKKEDDTKL